MGFKDKIQYSLKYIKIIKEGKVTFYKDEIIQGQKILMRNT